MTGDSLGRGKEWSKRGSRGETREVKKAGNKKMEGEIDR